MDSQKELRVLPALSESCITEWNGTERMERLANAKNEEWLPRASDGAFVLDGFTFLGACLLSCLLPLPFPFA